MDNYKGNHEISPQLKFYDFNCHGNGPMFCAQHFQVGSYPAVIVFSESGERLTRIDGLYPEQVVHNIIAEFNQKAIHIEMKKNKNGG
jgi:thioredoxin-like negative regulator of GroEL